MSCEHCVSQHTVGGLLRNASTHGAKRQNVFYVEPLCPVEKSECNTSKVPLCVSCASVRMNTEPNCGKAVVKLELMDLTPEQHAMGVRRSSRTPLISKRLMYSPEDATAGETKRRRMAKSGGKTIKTKRMDMEKDEVGTGELSAYELERLENIKQNKEFLSSLDIFKTSEELKQMTQRKPSQRGLRRAPPVKEQLPPRKSLRLQKIEAEQLTLPAEPTGTLRSLAEPATPQKLSGSLPMVPLNLEEGSKVPPQLLELMSEELKERKVEQDLKGYCSSLNNMQISEDNVAKVVKDRIFSAAFHPCSSSLLMAAGDKWGKVGLWKMGDDWDNDGVLLFQPHTRPVACMAFSRAHPSHLLSLSYDGSLRCMDAEKELFQEVYDIDDGLKTFDFMSHDCSTLVVGNWFGEVAIVDRRTPRNSHESLYSLDPKVLRCVSVHPSQKHYFAVAGSQAVSIYDSRCLKKTKCPPVSQLDGHSLSISSAYFSPVTGNRVLTTCLDNTIRIYDTSKMTTESTLLTSIRHDTQTGRWLSKLAAVWDPKQEDCFVVGCMSRPRQVVVFHESGRRQHTFLDAENVTTVLSVTAFHPTRNALLGGNASGRLHVFSD